MTEIKFGSAAILAGGRSLRMGFDKQLLTVNQQHLFESLCHCLQKRFDDIIVNTYRPELYVDYPVRTVRDVFSGLGPLAGIHRALTACRSQYVYIIACDMPNIHLDYVDYMEQLISRQNDPDACVTKRGDWIEPFNAFYSKNCLPVIEEDLLNNKTSIRYFLKKVNTLEIEEKKAREFSPNWSMFLNLNTKESYQKYVNSL